jgi:hypothetical protein
MMENLMDKSEIQEMIKVYYDDYMLEEYKQSLDRIDPVILDIVVSKSFNGVPLFILDLVDNLINSKKFVQILSGELIVTSELMDMVDRCWYNNLDSFYLIGRFNSHDEAMKYVKKTFK